MHRAYRRLYEPLFVPKEVAPCVWIVDGPVIEMSFPLGLRFPFTTRMTVVRLANGALWIHSPIEAPPKLFASIDSLGEVQHLVSPNFLHYACISAWKARYPGAVTWASPGVRERAARYERPLSFDRDLVDEHGADVSPQEWSDEIDQLLFRGSNVMREIVFFHKASRTLVLTDLIENFESDAMRPPYSWLVRLIGAAHPDGKAPVDLRATFRDREAARKSLGRMLSWQPERVLLAHGKWYDRDGTAELRRAFRWLRNHWP